MNIKCDKCGEIEKFAFHRVSGKIKECIAIRIGDVGISLGEEDRDDTIVDFTEGKEFHEFKEILHCRGSSCIGHTIKISDGELSEIRIAVDVLLLCMELREK